MRYREFRLNLMELSDAVRRQTAERWRKENTNINNDQINYYLNQWEKYSSGFEPKFRDITRLTFDQVNQLIDNAEARAELKGKAKSQQTFDQNDDLIYNQNNLVILKGDLREKCIQYGKGYSWCISRTDANNMFYNYRMSHEEPMFYFVFDKDKPKDDIWHAVVIYVDNQGVFNVATANNPGDVEMSWDKIVQKHPKLRGLEQLFVHQPLTPNERDDYEKYSELVDLEKYKSFGLREKIKYIKFGHKLTDEQQAATDDVDLLGLYAKTMPTRITRDTFQRIKSGDRRKIMSDLLQMKARQWVEFAQSMQTPWSQLGLPKDVVSTVENSIAKYPDLAYNYARDAIGGRWPEAEKVIIKEIQDSKRKNQSEISNNREIAAKYARDVIGGRWPEAEPAIANDPYAAYYYARLVIGGRWPEAEPAIANDRVARAYAKYVIKGPWPEAGIDKV